MERDLIDEVQIQPNHSKVHPIPIPSNADAALKFFSSNNEEKFADLVVIFKNF